MNYAESIVNTIRTDFLGQEDDLLNKVVALETKLMQAES